MKIKIVAFLLTFLVLVITIGCIDNSMPSENILSLDESVEKIDGLYPTMSNYSDKNYAVYRGKVIGWNETGVVTGFATYIRTYCVYFEDGTSLNVYDLLEHPINNNSVNRIVLYKSDSGAVTPQIRDIKWK